MTLLDPERQKQAKQYARIRRRLVKTPLLWLAGEKDAVVTVEHERQSAAHYKADFEVIPESAQNIMMEYNCRGTAELIHHWLEKHGIN